MLIFTICARNYLAYALTLRDSVLRHEPSADFLIFLADDAAASDEVRNFTVPMEALSIPDLEDMCFRYDVLELSTALKPFCFQHAMKTLGYSQAVYLDPDIQLFGALTEVRNAFAERASCVLTPHLLAPLPADGKQPSNLDILSSGTFNLGFAAFADTGESEAFLDWWARELRSHCYSDPSRGMFVDQKFVDFAPSFIGQLSVLRHPGYNVAYWNLAERSLSKTETGWVAGAEPLVFFHFSGVSVKNPGQLSKHQTRFLPPDLGPAIELVEAYIAQIIANGHETWSKTPYACGSFEDGSPIPLPVRRAAAEKVSTRADFHHYDANFWNAPDPDVDQSSSAPITRLMAGYHALRPDLRAAFPLSCARGRQRFHDWFIAYGAREYGLSPSQLGTPSKGSVRKGGKLARLGARVRLRLSQRP